MSWVNFFFFVICMNTVTGTAAYFLCRWVALLAEHVGAIRMIYPMYRLVEFFYIVPVGYLCSRFRYYDRVHADTVGDFFLGNLLIRVVVLALSVAWAYGAVKKGIEYAKKYESFRWTAYKNLPFFDEGYMKVLKRCYPGVIWKHVTLCTNFLLKSPCVMGTFHHDLVLPEVTYDRKDLEIILMHEATHIARYDNLWKKIGVGIIIVNWFNPVLPKYIDELNEWSDTACDITVCSRFLNNDTALYFEVLMRTRTKGRSLIPPFVSQMSDRESLKRRMERVIKWRMNGKKALAGVLLTAMLVAGSSVTALASGVGVSEAQQALYQHTREVVTTTENDSLGELEEYVIPAEEVDEEKWENAVVFEEEGIEPLTVQKNFDWNVPVGTFARSTAFIKKKGTTISVACYIYSDKYHRVGIRRPDGSMLCVNAKGNMAHTFTCESFGTYYVFVENMGSTDLHAAGYYVR